jgi:putative tryptophan/tyrosine transport system substrate-binding protein
VSVCSRRNVLRASVALAGLGLLAGCEPPRLPWQPPKVPRIGVLTVGTREERAFITEGFLHGLRELGYEEGQNIHIEYRFSEGRNERLPELAAELVALPVDLIVANGTPASVAAKQATSTIPIVMGGLAADPVATGFVASLNRPGGNITGMSMMTAPLGGKRLELLKETIPGLTRVAVFRNPASPTYGPILKELEAAAPALGLEALPLEVERPEDFEGAFQVATQQPAGALIVPADPLTTNRFQIVIDLGLTYRLPTLMEYKEFAQAGALLSFGVDIVDLSRRAATHVDKILNGASPAEIPMEQPTTLNTGVNLRTAQALGLTIPEVVLAQATQIFQ